MDEVSLIRLSVHLGRLKIAKMKITYGSVVVSAGFAGILSFGFLALAIGTEYWYIIDDNRFNYTEDSHSGLWRTHEGKIPSKLTC